MLNRLHRFHGHTAVRTVYQKGRAVRSGFGSLHYRLNDRRKTYRAAVVVSKKVSKSAVVRNRIRRRVYEVIRTAGITASYELVVTIHTETAADMPALELQHTVRNLLDQAGVISKRPD
jgi:ribonuclease P protein component